VSQFLSHGIAIAGGACRGIGCSAGGQNDPICPKRFTLCLCTGNMSIFCQDMPDAGSFYRNISASQLLLQTFQHGYRFIRNRKHPVPPFRFQFTAVAFKESLCFFRRKRCHGTVKESAVSGGILQDFLFRTVICYIAAALAGNKQFLTQPVIAFQKQDALPL